jgi:hypothetical protein
MSWAVQTTLRTPYYTTQLCLCSVTVATCWPSIDEKPEPGHTESWVLILMTRGTHNGNMKRPHRGMISRRLGLHT